MHEHALITLNMNGIYWHIPEKTALNMPELF